MHTPTPGYFEESRSDGRSATRYEPDQNVAPAERLLSLIAGGFLLANGVGRRDLTGAAEAMAGAYLATRGATGHCAIYERIGVTTAHGGDAANLPVRKMVHVQKGFTVNRPAEELYAFWRRLENLPSFMEHLESVTELDGGRSRWVAKGPLGTRVEWEAEITDEEPGRFISWCSVEGSTVANAGMVRFDPAPPGRGTEVRVSLEYAPPAGAIGDVIAKLFGESPEQQIEDDLRHFKQLLEAGEIPTTEGQPSGRAASRSASSRAETPELERSPSR